MKCGNDWKCVGGTHEYWGGDPTGKIPYEIIYIDDKNDGGQRYGSVMFAYEAPMRPQVSFVSKNFRTVLGKDAILVKFLDLEFQSAEALPVIHVSFGDMQTKASSFAVTGAAQGRHSS
jgi:hypothetical protein